MEDTPFPKLFQIAPNNEFTGVEVDSPLRNQRNQQSSLDVQSLMKGF